VDSTGPEYSPYGSPEADARAIARAAFRYRRWLQMMAEARREKSVRKKPSRARVVHSEDCAVVAFRELAHHFAKKKDFHSTEELMQYCDRGVELCVEIAVELKRIKDGRRS
jgi:hypothetical protein